MTLRRRARRLAADALAVLPPAAEVERARAQVRSRIAARASRLTDPTVVLPPVDERAHDVLAADRRARGGLDPEQARDSLLRWLEDDRCDRR